MSVAGTKLLLRARECSLPSEGVARGWNDIEWDKAGKVESVDGWWECD